VAAARAKAGGLAGEIQVGYAPSLTVQILPQALRVFQAEFPGVRVMLHDLSTEEMLSQLHAGKLQLALMVQPTRKTLRGLRFEELARYPLQVAVAPSHPLAKLRSLSLEKVAKERLIGYSQKDYPEYHDQMAALFQTVGRKPQIVQEHEGVTSLIAAVESGRGVALVPSCVACMVGARLKMIPLAPSGPPIVVGAIVREGAVPSVAGKFIAAARTRK
ncbi:MAG: LysR family substrate-binding domain-containing protein, partial [Verrucomicrobiota bacterium]